MKTTRLSSKGQVIIPKPIRTQHRWQAGQELIVIEVGDGVLLRPKKSFPQTDVEDVAGCLKYSGQAKSLDEMEAAIEKGVRESSRDRD